MRRIRFPNDDRARQVIEILEARVYDDGCAASAVAMRAAVVVDDELVFDLDDDACAEAARMISGYGIIGKACLFFSEAHFVEGPSP